MFLPFGGTSLGRGQEAQAAESVFLAFGCIAADKTLLGKPGFQVRSPSMMVTRCRDVHNLPHVSTVTWVGCI